MQSQSPKLHLSELICEQILSLKDFLEILEQVLDKAERENGELFQTTVQEFLKLHGLDSSLSQKILTQKNHQGKNLSQAVFQIIRERLVLKADLESNLSFNLILELNLNDLLKTIFKIFDATQTVTKIIHKIAKNNPKLSQYLLNIYTQKTLQIVRQNNIRPCSYYQIKQCGGVCLGLESKEQYQERLEKIGQVLTGRTRPVEEFIHTQIQKSVTVENYELAAFWRDKLKILETLAEDQKIVLDKSLNLDIITFYLDAKISLPNGFENESLENSAKNESGKNSNEPEYLDFIENSNLDTCSVFVQSIRDGRMVNVNNYLMSGSFDGEEELEDGFEGEFEEKLGEEFEKGFKTEVENRSESESVFEKNPSTEYEIIFQNNTRTDFDTLLKDKFEYFVRQFLMAYRSSATETVPVLIQTWC